MNRIVTPKYSISPAISAIHLNIIQITCLIAVKLALSRD